MNLATILTLSRVVLGPLILVFYTYHSSMGIPLIVLPYILLGLLIVEELTDALDGYFARKYNHVTDLGKKFSKKWKKRETD